MRVMSAVRASTARSAAARTLQGFGFLRAEIGGRLFERGPFSAQRFECPLVFGGAFGADSHERGDRPGRPAEVPRPVCFEEESRVASASTLVEVHELGLEIRQLRRLLLFERREPRVGLQERGPGLRCRSLGTCDALHLEVAFDFQGTQIADECSRPAGELLCLTLEGGDASGHAPGQRLGEWTRRNRKLSGPWHRQGQQDEEEDRKGPTAHGA